MSRSVVKTAAATPESTWFVYEDERAGPSSKGAPQEPTKVEVATRAEEDEAPPSGSIGVEWQRLWLSTQRRPWATLALIPVGEGIPTLKLAGLLVAAGREHLSGTIIACDETNVSLSTLQTSLAEITERTHGAERVILAFPEVLQSPASLALARAADAVILCLGLGTSMIDEAERILDEVGRERVLGSVLFREMKEMP